MIEMIRRVFELAGDRRSVLLQATLLNVLQNCCTGAIYLVVLLAIMDITMSRFTGDTLIARSLAMACLLVVRYALHYRVTTLQSFVGYDIMHDVRVRESRRLAELPLGTFRSEGVGNLTSTFTNDMGFIEMRCIATASTFIAGMTSVAFISVAMLVLDFRLALVSMAGFIPAFFVYRHAAAMFRRFGIKRAEMERTLIGGILEYVSGMETIRSYRMCDKVFSRISEGLDGFRDASAAYELKGVLPMTLYQLSIRIGMGCIFVFGLLFYLEGMTDLPVFLFFAVISATYYQPVEALLGEFALLNIMALSLDSIDALHGRSVMKSGSEHMRELPAPSVENAVFAYAADKAPVIRDVSAAFAPGSLTAIVGHSGSGKTTLLMLLARFWDTDLGVVRMGGSDVRKLAPAELMGACSMVFQDVCLFSGTVAENILMGRPGATRGEMEAAARAAGCHDFISKMPEGYETLIGEDGCTLSGGERQRISIARAILKNAPVVLLDEAFSSVDPENSWAIQQGITELTRNKTVIMVAHTLNHIRTAGRILVMEKGRIVEQGTHEELLKAGTVYGKLWETENAARSWRIS